MRLLRLDIRTYIFLYGHRFLYKVLLAIVTGILGTWTMEYCSSGVGE